MIGRDKASNLVSNTEQLANLLDTAAQVKEWCEAKNFQKLMDQFAFCQLSDFLDDLASVSNLIHQIRNHVVYDFIDYFFGSQLHPTLMSLIAIRLQLLLDNKYGDLYEKFNELKDSGNKPDIEIIFKPINEILSQPTYQVLFDVKNRIWEVSRFSPENKIAQIVKHWQVDECLSTAFSHLTKETLNPFIKKTLFLVLQDYEYNYQRKEKLKTRKALFAKKYNYLHEYIMTFSSDLHENLKQYQNVNYIFDIISFVSNHAQWCEARNLLEKDSIKQVLLQTTNFEFSSFLTKPARQCISKIILDGLSHNQLEKLKRHELNELCFALPKEEFANYLEQGKIKFDYPRFCHEIEDLYKSYPDLFPTLLRQMIVSGKIIGDLPRGDCITTDKYQQGMLEHYVNLLFHYKGAWFYLIKNDEDSIHNHRLDLLCFAMKKDPNKTIGLLSHLAYLDENKDKCLPITLTAEELSIRIEELPQLYVLLEFANISNTLKHDSKTIMSDGKIRRFDQLYRIVCNIPPLYASKLLGKGIFFSEIGMSQFHHSSEAGLIPPWNPGESISANFAKLHHILPPFIFYYSLERGLKNNKNVDSLFLKDIFNIDLMELEKVLKQFQHIKYLELGLSPDKDNLDNIIIFFNAMKKNNPHLDYHLQLMLTKKIKPFEFICNYLAGNHIKIKSLNILSKDKWVNETLLYTEKSSFKNLFEDCIRNICEKNHILRRITFSDITDLQLTRFPLYNTSMYSIFDSNGETESLILRNRNISALRCLSDNIRQYRNILELLPWLSLNHDCINAEIIKKIFNVMMSLQKQPSSMADIKAMNMNAWYYYKPHKKTIDNLANFLLLDHLQHEVITAINNWFDANKRKDVSTILSDFKKHEQIIEFLEKYDRNSLEIRKLQEEKSRLELVHQIDGIYREEVYFSENNARATKDYCELINKLNYYQKALAICLKRETFQAYISLQCEGPINNTAYWNDLSRQRFDGEEFSQVLARYNQHQDIQKSDKFLKDIRNKVFSDFKDEEYDLFRKILAVCNNYLLKKSLNSKDRQTFKNQLFQLIKPDKIAIFEKSRPRLYCILRSQRQRLAASIDRCSLKSTLSSHGLFSLNHHKNKMLNKSKIFDLKEKINNQLCRK